MGKRTPTVKQLAGVVDTLLSIFDTRVAVEALPAADRRHIANARDMSDQAREGGAR